MDELQYTLLSDGPADKALMPVLNWLLQQHVPNLPIQSRWADLRRLRQPPRQLYERILKSIELFPCDLLFIHRDAETASPEERRNEIEQAAIDAGIDNDVFAVICVVPVRMTEAWLLFDVAAIREAAGNPNGTVPIYLPDLSTIEGLANPKKMLNKVLLTATELGTYRKKRFDTSRAVQRVPEYIDDFSTLRRLPAFAALEKEVKKKVESKGWNS